MRRVRRIGILLGLLLAATATVGWAIWTGRLRFNYPSRAELPIRGIDVAHHQGVIDWAAVKASGEVDFAYIKATEGGDWRDPRFLENWTAARAQGLRVGAYHFFTLCTPATAQARNFSSIVPQAGDALPPVVDLEFGGNCADRPDAITVRRELELWLSLVEASSGRRPVLYVTYEFFDQYLRPGAPLADLWIRDIFFRPRLPEPWRYPLWQLGNRGRIPGIVGPVDLDAFLGDAQAWSRFASGA